MIVSQSNVWHHGVKMKGWNYFLNVSEALHWYGSHSVLYPFILMILPWTVQQISPPPLNHKTNSIPYNKIIKYWGMNELHCLAGNTAYKTIYSSPELVLLNYVCYRVLQMTFHDNCGSVSLGFQPGSRHYATGMTSLDYMLVSNVKHVKDNRARWRVYLLLHLLWRQAQCVEIPLAC